MSLNLCKENYLYLCGKHSNTMMLREVFSRHGFRAPRHRLVFDKKYCMFCNPNAEQPPEPELTQQEKIMQTLNPLPAPNHHSPLSAFGAGKQQFLSFIQRFLGGK